MSSIAPALSREQSIEYGLEKWNAQPGAAFQVRVTLNNDQWAQYALRETTIFNGAWLLKQPGPFKRLASFAVGCQYYDLFDITSTDGRSISTVDWAPRIALWLLEFVAPSISVRGKPLRLTIASPTAHFQADLIGYLRSLRAILGKHPEHRSEMGLNTERIITVGLILEAATYASSAGIDCISEFLTAADSCVAGASGPTKKELAIDILFNDPEFLENATGIGLN